MMTASLSSRLRRKVLTHLFGMDRWIDRTGDFRTREQYGLINRPQYVYGMLRAADQAKYIGAKSVTVVELGVASGGGLLNMVDCAKLITSETGVTFRIVGFDTGAGLPSVQGYKDHPEIWNPGDFAMEDRTTLETRLQGKAQIIWGDIERTINTFSESLTEDAPLGFVAVDVDIYTATRAGLRCLTGAPQNALPAVSMYFDDVSFFYANRWCGELAAIEEFNATNAMRKIDRDYSMAMRPKPAAGWYQSMYVAHMLDHPTRQSSLSRNGLSIQEHFEFMKKNALT